MTLLREQLDLTTSGVVILSGTSGSAHTELAVARPSNIANVKYSYLISFDF